MFLKSGIGAPCYGIEGYACECCIQGRVQEVDIIKNGHCAVRLGLVKQQTTDTSYLKFRSDPTSANSTHNPSTGRQPDTGKRKV